MFEKIQAAPPDAILGLTDAFKRDPNPQKVNLGVGVYKDEEGKTPILESVRQAETFLLQEQKSKSYLPIDGDPVYDRATRELLFGPESALLDSGRVVVVQTPGGTGALRVAADFLAQTLGAQRTAWISDPSWPNHPAIFQAAGLSIESYPYFNSETNGVDFAAMLARLAKAEAGDIVVLHTCCHNPTGVDLSPDQWQEVAELLATRGLLPLLDFAYQGFAKGLYEDTIGLRILNNTCSELLIANSFSKNFGLYNERIGALTLVAQDANSAEAAHSRLKRSIRSNYSNPPAHGSAIVKTILNDPSLRSLWEDEIDAMRDRINRMRHLMVESLSEMGVEKDFSYVTQQQGMFSYSGLTPKQVRALRQDYAIYIVGSGRINVAGLTEANMAYLCRAIAEVIAL